MDIPQPISEAKADEAAESGVAVGHVPESYPPPPAPHPDLNQSEDSDLANATAKVGCLSETN